MFRPEVLEFIQQLKALQHKLEHGTLFPIEKIELAKHYWEVVHTQDNTYKNAFDNFFLKKEKVFKLARLAEIVKNFPLLTRGEDCPAKVHLYVGDIYASTTGRKMRRNHSELNKKYLKLAQQHYLKAVDAHDDIAMCKLAMLHKRIGMPVHKAIDLLMQAISLNTHHPEGSLRARELMWSILAQQKHNLPDNEPLRLYYLMLAHYFDIGIGGARYPLRATKIYRFLVQTVQCDIAAYKLGCRQSVYLDLHDPHYLNWFVYSAKLKRNNQLGSIAALRYLEKAHTLRPQSTNVALSLAKCYLDGCGGEQNIRKGVRLYETYAVIEHDGEKHYSEEAIIKLGCMYLDGLYGMGVNIELAAYYYFLLLLKAAHDSHGRRSVHRALSYKSQSYMDEVRKTSKVHALYMEKKFALEVQNNRPYGFRLYTRLT